MRAADEPGTPIVRILVSLGLDYVRWTQFVPMLMAWAFLLAMVGAMLLVNFQQQSFGLIESGMGIYERAFGPIEDPDPRPSAAASARDAGGSAPTDTARPDGAVRFTGDDLESWVLRIWGVAALAGWLLGIAWRRLFGVPPRMPLTRKLLLTAVAGLACTLSFLFAYFFGSERFNGGFGGWLALFVGAPFVVWCVSAWSLAISAGITWLQDRIAEPHRLA